MTSQARRSASPAKPKTAKQKSRTVKKVPRLTDRMKVFVAEYAKDRNGTQAAIRAGYSPKTAQEQASVLLSKPIVRAAVDETLAKIAAKCELSAERTLREVARLAYFDPRKLFDAKGDPIPLTELDDDTAAAIAGLDVLEEVEGSGENRRFVGYVKKYKIADKNAALEKAMKHHGLYKADNTQQADAMASMLAELSQRGSRLPIKGLGK